MAREWGETTIAQPRASGHGTPPPRRSPSHRCASPCGWRHFRDAAIGAFFLSASLPFLAVASHIWRWHL